MSNVDYSGYWTGTIEGTNQGGLTLNLAQNDKKISGMARLNEPTLGQYEYHIDGVVDEKSISLQLIPGKQTGDFTLGKVQVICSLDAENSLIGRWKSDIDTEGIFSAKRFTAKLPSELPKNNSIFLVHGQDEGTKHSVARFLELLGVTPVILQEQINRGMTVIEKFEDVAARAGFAVILMTPDDLGYPAGREEEKKPRPRQNVVLELGYFVAKLGRSKSLVLIKGDLEMPSDIMGLVYEKMDNSEGWKMRLARELKGAGFDIDLNRAIS